jgi:putative ABC transport system ATP-binding protein
MIQLQHIKKAFKEKVLFNDLNLTIPDHSFVALVGQSGSGKTTLLNLIGCLDLKYEGSYLFTNGNVPQDISAKKRYYGRPSLRSHLFSFVFQDSNLIEYYSVKENVILPLRYRFEKIDHARVEAILKDLGILEIADKRVSLLSGGEKQRVALARCLIMDSPVILADEPTGSLDFDNTKIVIKALKDAGKHYQKTVIVVTHNRDILPEFDQVVNIDDIKG